MMDGGCNCFPDEIDFLASMAGRPRSSTLSVLPFLSPPVIVLAILVFLTGVSLIVGFSHPTISGKGTPTGGNFLGLSTGALDQLPVFAIGGGAFHAAALVTCGAAVVELGRLGSLGGNFGALDTSVAVLAVLLALSKVSIEEVE